MVPKKQMSLCHESDPLNLASTLFIICTISLSIDAQVTWFMGRLDGAIKLMPAKCLVIFSFINHINICIKLSPKCLQLNLQYPHWIFISLIVYDWLFYNYILPKTRLAWLNIQYPHIYVQNFNFVSDVIFACNHANFHCSWLNLHCLHMCVTNFSLLNIASKQLYIPPIFGWNTMKPL